jgi:pimeloyl-ACP methyl ester carboxylesterase
MDQIGRNGDFEHFERRPWRCLTTSGVLCAAFLTLLTCTAVAKEEPEPPPKPRNVNLPTKDGVGLNTLYYEGTEGEKTVPVVVIHDWKEKEDGATYESLAEYLQSKGYAVILPDLRGHGSSTRQKKDARQSRTLTSRNVKPENVVAGDLEAVRMFLLEENNAKKLNLAATTLIGVGKGAILAAHYAIYDWDPSVRGGNTRVSTQLRGGNQDVRALILVSPQTKISKQMKIDALSRHPTVGTGEVSTLILVGQKQGNAANKEPKETRESKTAQNIYARLKQNDHITETDDVGKWTLFLKALDTEHNGETLLNETEHDLGARATVASFLELRLRNRDHNFPWTERKPYKN